MKQRDEGTPRRSVYFGARHKTHRWFRDHLLVMTAILLLLIALSLGVATFFVAMNARSALEDGNYAEALVSVTPVQVRYIDGNEVETVVGEPGVFRTTARDEVNEIYTQHITPNLTSRDYLRYEFRVTNDSPNNDHLMVGLNVTITEQTNYAITYSQDEQIAQGTKTEMTTATHATAGLYKGEEYVVFVWIRLIDIDQDAYLDGTFHLVIEYV